MADLLAIVLPVFGLIGIGYVGRRTGFVSERMGDGLSEFVFSLSVPCLIFNTLVRAEIPAVQPWGYWISYFAGVGVVWTLAMVLGRRLLGRPGEHRLRRRAHDPEGLWRRGSRAALSPDRRAPARDHDARDDHGR